METLDPALAELTIRDYVCSTCWGHLVKFPEHGGYRVECPNCEETKGYVTKFYANKRLSESVGDRLDVQVNLRDVPGMNPHRNKSVEQLLDELGF